MFQAIGRFRSCRDVVDCMEYLSAVITRSTIIANADRYTLEDYESLLVLKSLSVDFLGSNGPIAVFTRVAVKSLVSGIC